MSSILSLSLIAPDLTQVLITFANGERETHDVNGRLPSCIPFPSGDGRLWFRAYSALREVARLYKEGWREPHLSMHLQGLVLDSNRRTEGEDIEQHLTLNHLIYERPAPEPSLARPDHTPRDKAKTRKTKKTKTKARRRLERLFEKLPQQRKEKRRKRYDPFDVDAETSPKLEDDSYLPPGQLSDYLHLVEAWMPHNSCSSSQVEHSVLLPTTLLAQVIDTVDSSEREMEDIPYPPKRRRRSRQPIDETRKPGI